jgi:amino acid transporter
MADESSLADDRINASFGYKQELRRALKLFSLYAVAFSIISITTGLSTNYGAALGALGPAAIWLWIIASLGQVLVALVVAELGTRIPLAGYSYQWGARLVNTAYGWFTGFIGLSYLSVGAAAINFVVVAPLIATLLGLNATNPTVNLVITLVIFAVNLAVNMISVALAARINNVAVFTEIIGMVGFAIVLFVAWAIHPNHDLGFLLTTGPAKTSGAILAAIPVAALMGIFTLVGFELAADLGEEAIGARITVPKAVMWSVGSSAILGLVALIGFTIAVPDVAKIAASPTPLVDIVSHWLGYYGAAVFLVLVTFSILALDVIGLAATGRLVFAMARDNILPASTWLRVVNPTTRTPIRSLVTASASACSSPSGGTSARSPAGARAPSSSW